MREQLYDIHRNTEMLQQAQRKKLKNDLKKETEQELVEKCRQSLARDRQKARTLRKLNRTETTDVSSDCSKETNLNPPPSLSYEQQQQSPSPSKKFSLSSLSHDIIMEETTPQMDVNKLLSHERQLVDLFGMDMADNFINPKMDLKANQKKAFEKVKRHCGDGANELWDSLRGFSMKNLMHRDAVIPKSVKDSYGAFVRECYTKNIPAAKRGFYMEKQTPVGERPLDKRYEQTIIDRSRMLGVIHQIAQSNGDRTGVLIFNNPDPDLNDYEGRTGPARFSSVVSGTDTVYCYSATDNDVNTVNAMKPVSNIKHTDNKHKRVGGQDKYIFLTEKMAECPGKFTAEREGRRSMDQIKVRPVGLMYGSLPPLSVRASLDSADCVSSVHSRSKARKKSDNKVKTTWQPLSLGALVEYAHQVDVMGKGDFSQGRSKPFNQQQTLGEVIH